MTPAERATFAALADILVPGTDGMPRASEIGAHERWLDRVLDARPDLRVPLAALLAAASDRDPHREVVRLRREEGDGFALLLLVVTAAYYLSPKVKRLIAYPGQRPREVFPDQADHDLRDGILDPVIGRGPVWRRAPQ